MDVHTAIHRLAAPYCTCTVWECDLPAGEYGGVSRTCGRHLVRSGGDPTTERGPEDVRPSQEHAGYEVRGGVVCSRTEACILSGLRLCGAGRSGKCKSAWTPLLSRAGT